MISSTAHNTLSDITEDKREQFMFVLKGMNDMENVIDTLKTQHDSMSMIGVITKNQLKEIILKLSFAHHDLVGSTVELLANCDLGGGLDIKHIRGESD